MNEPRLIEGKTLKELIKDARLSYPELAKRINCSRSTVAYYVSGEKTPGLDKAIAMARELGVSLKCLSKSMGYDVTGIPNDE